MPASHSDPSKNAHESSSDLLYLERLTFNPELKKTFLNFFVTHFRVVLLLIGLLTLWGVYSFLKLPVESDPEVKIPIAVVVTAYPGASPSDIEELVTKKIETNLAGLKNLSKLTSSSSNSISSVTVEFDARVDLEDSIRKLRDQVNSLKKDLPDEANEPVVREISIDDTPIFTASLAGSVDGFALRGYAETIQDELEKISGVREVRVSGGDEAEFEVAYDPVKLIQYRLSPDQVNQRIAAANVAIPSGSFEGERFTYPVRADARFFDAETLANLPLSHTDSGAFVFLKDIAQVREKAIKKVLYSRFSSKGLPPENAITIEVIKKTGGSILETAKASKERLDAILATMPSGLHYDVSIDVSEEIGRNFKQLTHDFLLTVMLVFGILFITIGLKEALVAGLAVPLVFFATFGVMLMSGVSLNFLSMFSLILALGLLVDDAIVVVSATKQYLKTGKFTPEEAVLLVLNDFKVVLTTTTLITVWAFLPLLLASGIIGQYIRSIPITVSVTLVSSLVIALLVNHPLAAVLERVRLSRGMFFLSVAAALFAGLAGVAATQSAPLKILFAGAGLVITGGLLRWYFGSGKSRLKANEALMEAESIDPELIKKKLREQGNHPSAHWVDKLIHGPFHMNRVLPYYERALRAVLATRKSRRLTLAAAFVMLVAAILLPVMGVVRSEFFPVADSDIVFVNLKASTGLKLDETSLLTRQVEEKLLKYPEISNFSTLVGVPPVSGGIGGGGSANPSHSASIVIRLVKPEQRTIKAYEFADSLRVDLDSVQGATITVQSLSGGPPSGAAFEARILGDDLKTLDRIAHDLEPMLASVAGVTDTDISLKPSSADYTFSLQPSRLEFYRLNAAYVGMALRMAIAGTEVTKVLRDGKEIKVMARFDDDRLPTLSSLQNLQILNLRGEPVFLKDLASIELKPSVDTITRIDQKRAVLLSANVKAGVPANQVLADFQEAVKSYSMPDDYHIVYGGENEENQESVVSILRAMVIAGLLIFSTLVVQFNSFRKSMIVIMAIPLALIGVFFGLAVSRITLSFPGLIGIVALFGIVVKNAIILIDKINLNIHHGIPFETAIVDAGKSRMEAIVITSACTIVGILPVTLSDEVWKALGSTVIFGLMVSSFFTLFIIPVLFRSLVREKAVAKMD